MTRPTGEIEMAEQKATNVTWHEHAVNPEEREKLSGHRGAVLWFTGLSASGKSTVANIVDQKLHEQGRRTFVLDGDNVRMGLNKNLGFSAEDRTENIRRIGEVAKLFAESGAITTTAFISPYRADRDAVREIMPEGRFIEILVDADIAVCEARDPKGLYKKARAGEIKGFTGIDDPYEAPEKAEIVVDGNGDKTPDALADEVIAYLDGQGLLSPLSEIRNLGRRGPDLVAAQAGHPAPVREGRSGHGHERSPGGRGAHRGSGSSVKGRLSRPSWPRTPCRAASLAPPGKLTAPSMSQMASWFSRIDSMETASWGMLTPLDSIILA